MSLNPWHRFLIKHYPYCERCTDGKTKATTVRTFNGKEIVLCEEHAERLDAVRISELKQEVTQKTYQKLQPK